jgi:beta-N-acetylhexosaminidase
MNLGPIMMDVSGLTLTQLEETQLAKPSIGGVILFSRNFESINQVKQPIRVVNPNILISVDHEGGRVQRFKEGFTHLPAMSKLGELYDKKPKKAIKYACSCGFILAYELLEIDVDFSFAPVLDMDYGNSSVIGDRAFHSNPDAIIKLAQALIKGMHRAGMKCVGKHFPGHGYVSLDSHLDLPIDDRPAKEVYQDMATFKGLVDEGLDAVMPAHVIYSKVDDKPAGFSNVWIQDILKSQLGFDGVVFSDDLSMQGALFIENIKDRVKISLDSGCDMVLICNHPEMLLEVIDQDWGSNEKLQSMQGNRRYKSDKITHLQHLETIKSLL